MIVLNFTFYIRDFHDMYDSALGNCFTFNYMNPPKYLSQRAGKDHGLTILLQTSQKDYLCTSQTAGFRVLIHNYTEYPFPDALGYNISPGTVTGIALMQVRTSVNSVYIGNLSCCSPT